MVVVFCQAQQAPVLMTAKYNYSNNSFNLKCQLKWTSLVHQQTLVKLCCGPKKQTASTVHVTLGSFGKLNKVIFPSQPKTHVFRDILPERSRAALMGSLSHWMREKCPYMDFHPSIWQEVL